MRGHHANKRVYETILKDLRAYDSYSGGLFDDLDSIDVQLSRGLSQIESSWDAKQGVFKVPSDLTWANYLTAYADTKDLQLSRQEKAFVQTMMAEYGFDAETAQQLLTIKKGIDKKFPTSSQEFRDYIFLRVVGAAYYNESSPALRRRSGRVNPIRSKVGGRKAVARRRPDGGPHERAEMLRLDR